jgi:GT2 family glycosyltransferase
MAYTKSKVSIIILNWNGFEDTVECLESLKKITYPNYEVILVDNGSRGNDAQVLEEKFGDYIHLIQNDHNYGYTGGNNIGMRYVLHDSASEYILILNNDTVVAPDLLDNMVQVAESDPSIGMVGSKVCYYDFPGRIQGIGGKVNMWTGRASLIGFKEIDTGQYDKEQEVDYIFGCCLLVKTEVVRKIGLFDESYFCYWDETDYCFRARTAGYRVVYAPAATVWHKASLQLKVWCKSQKGGRVGGSSYYYMARNNFKFMRKHADKVQYLSFVLCFFGFYVWLVTGVCLLFHRDVRQFIAFWRGARDGLVNSSSGVRHYISD